MILASFLMESVIDKIVPVSDFNKGKAGKIFRRVEEDGEIFVVKNNRPAAVVVSLRRWKMFTAALEAATAGTPALHEAVRDARKGKVSRAGTTREDIASALWDD